MVRLINTTAMTLEGVVDVGDWFVGEGDHDAAAFSLFTDDVALLLGRKTYEGPAAYWPAQSGRAATVPIRLLEAKPYDSGVTFLRYQPLSATSP
jgi:dihydrofolate reductase